MPTIDIYTRAYCPYCARARHLLKARGLPFTEISVDTDIAADRRMQERSGRTSVPQIFIDDHHIGGSDELHAADASGLLARLLDKAA